VSFGDIADWCAAKDDGRTRNERQRTQIYIDLEKSAIRGVFKLAGRQRHCVLYLPDGSTNSAKPLKLRLNAEDLWRWSKASAPGLVHVLDDCWIPRDLCAKWLTKRGIDLPEWFSAGDDLPHHWITRAWWSAKPSSSRSSELLKLGIDIGQTSVAKYMARHRRPPSHMWTASDGKHNLALCTTWTAAIVCPAFWRGAYLRWP
jgi:hypothetical protein